MNSSKTVHSATGLLRPDAERLIHTLWAAYNNSTLYGNRHPLAEAAVAAFERKIIEQLHTVTPITFHMGDDAMHCEQWRIQKEGFATRLTARFLDMKVQSITFHRGLRREEIEIFLLLIGSAECDSVEVFEAGLAREGVRHLEPNFVTYQKVTKNDTVVRREVSEAMTYLVGKGDDTQSRAFGMSAAVAGSFPVATGEELSLVERIRMLRDSLLSPPGSFVSQEDIDALSQARVTLQHLAAQAPEEERETATRELNEAMFDVVARIVREEYSRGGMSVRRLAQIVRKLLPESRELRAFLPRLRDLLLEQEMPLEVYAEVVSELALEFEQEGALHMLGAAATRVGVSLTEVLQGLRDDPDTVVRLVLLVAEIERGLDVGRSEKIDLLDRFIERVVPLPGSGGLPEQGSLTGAARRELIETLENELLGELSARRTPREHTDSGGFQEETFSLVCFAVNELVGDPDGVVAGQIAPQLRRVVEPFVDQVLEDAASADAGKHESELLKAEEQLLVVLEQRGADPAVMGKVQSQFHATIRSCLERVRNDELAVQRAARSEGVRQEGASLPAVSVQRGVSQEETGTPVGGDAALPAVAPHSSGYPKIPGTEQAQGGVCGGGSPVHLHNAEGERLRPGPVPTSKKRLAPFPGVMKKVEVRRKVDEEIVRNKRYRTPLSCIAISFLGALREGEVTAQTDEELDVQARSVTALLTSMLRDLDSVGTLGVVEGFYQVFALLVMTDMQGAAIVKGRISERLRTTQLEAGSGPFRPAVAVSLVVLDEKKHTNASRFLRSVRDRHRAIVRKVMARRPGE